MQCCFLPCLLLGVCSVGFVVFKTLMQLCLHNYGKKRGARVFLLSKALQNIACTSLFPHPQVNIGVFFHLVMSVLNVLVLCFGSLVIGCCLLRSVLKTLSEWLGILQDLFCSLYLSTLCLQCLCLTSEFFGVFYTPPLPPPKKTVPPEGPILN